MNAEKINVGKHLFNYSEMPCTNYQTTASLGLIKSTSQRFTDFINCKNNSNYSQDIIPER